MCDKIINNMELSYFILGERSKVRKGGPSGTGGSEVYMPRSRWEFYSALQFMFVHQNAGEGTSDSMMS